MKKAIFFLTSIAILIITNLNIIACNKSTFLESPNNIKNKIKEKNKEEINEITNKTVKLNNKKTKNNIAFFSHNFKDKDIIEPIALKLTEILGSDMIFYDSWSIQPGEIILNKMEEALNSCEFFFLFISKNSLNSKMVELELHAALIKLNSINNKIKIITIRLENIIEMPIFLKNIKWIDFFTLGFDLTVKSIYDIITGNNVFLTKFKTINNITGSINIIDKINAEIKIEILQFSEPLTEIVLIWKNKENLTASSYNTNHIKIGKLINMKNNKKIKCFLMQFISNKFYYKEPIKIKIKSNFNLYKNYVFIYYKKNKEWLEQIPINIITKENMLNWTKIPKIPYFISIKNNPLF